MSAAARPSRERPGYFSKFLFCKASSRTCVKISQTRTQDQSGALESTLQHKLKKEGLKMPNPSHRTVTRRSQRLSDELPSDPQLYHARRDLLEACRAPCAPTSLGGLGHARAIALDCVQPFPRASRFAGSKPARLKGGVSCRFTSKTAMASCPPKLKACSLIGRLAVRARGLSIGIS